MTASLPSFVKSRRNRQAEKRTSQDAPGSSDSSTVVAAPASDHRSAEPLSKQQIKRATRTRKTFALITSACLVITVIFLILVEIGNTHKSSSTLTKIWFMKLDLSEIAGASIPNAALLNSIARTIGLHDFYTVGLWNFCEGYNGEGVTHCSKPESLYWFNPVKILLNELLSGATIELPAEITDILSLIKKVSQVMFGLFMTGTCLSFAMIFVTPLSVYSRWLTLAVSLLAFVASLCTVVASVIATVMFVIFKKTIAGQEDLNIKAALGARMFAFMWIASAFSLLATLIQFGLCCCCASRRDVRLGKKKGSKKAYTEGSTTATTTTGAAA